MSDLVERLRDGLTLYSLNAEAADRIEELEAKVESLLGICGDPRDKARIEQLKDQLSFMTKECKRFEAVLQQIANWNDDERLTREADDMAEEAFAALEDSDER